MARFGPLIAVAIGGAGGALSRWGILNQTSDDWSTVALWAINVAGSLLLGALIGRRELIGSQVYAAVGTGFAGGFTTFSGYAVEVANGLDDGDFSVLIAGVATPLVALAAAGIGYRISRRAAAKRAKQSGRSQGK